jgi:hypothetical protein
VVEIFDLERDGFIEWKGCGIFCFGFNSFGLDLFKFFW